MRKIFLPILLISTLVVSFTFKSCTKLDTTNIGSDLLPAIDNVTTFLDSIPVNTSQFLFADTTKLNLFADQVLGSINDDPLFGTTKASMYFQFKPTFYPFRYGASGDTLNGFGAGFDSAVLCINYKGFWGDSNTLQNLIVKEITDSDFADSTQIKITNPSNANDTGFVPNARRISYQPTTGNTLANVNVDIRKLKNKIYFGGSVVTKDSTINQIRIKLPNSYGNGLFFNDTTANPLQNDKNFRTAFKGLAIIAGNTGNALMYTSLNSNDSRIEVHYRRRTAGRLDTTYSILKMTTFPNPLTDIKYSAAANNIVRNRSGYPAGSPSATEIYLQATPGGYINLDIPSLSSLSNRIVHRAELILEQVPNNFYYDTIFRAPDFLYLDLVDTSASLKWKPIYYDLNPNTFYNPDATNGTLMLPSQFDYQYFGGYRRNKLDKFGNNISFYSINVTRHVQQIITKHTPNYRMRIFAPYQVDYGSRGILQYNNLVALGRVKLGSGINPNYRMILRMIWSKI